MYNIRVRKIIVFFGILLLIAFVFWGFSFSKNLQNNQTSPTPTPNLSKNAYCMPSDLSAAISAGGAAGSIYDTVTIRNVTNKNCEVVGTNFITPIFTAKNIKVVKNGEPGLEVITLLPGQKVYSLIRYPNGPQCNGQLAQVSISYRYNIYLDSFVEINGQSIRVCKDSSETQIDVWSLSDKPIN